MSIAVNIYYSGVGGNARKFAEEMESSGNTANLAGSYTSADRGL